MVGETPQRRLCCILPVAITRKTSLPLDCEGPEGQSNFPVLRGHRGMTSLLRHGLQKDVIAMKSLFVLITKGSYVLTTKSFRSGVQAMVYEYRRQESQGLLQGWVAAMSCPLQRSQREVRTLSRYRYKYNAQRFLEPRLGASPGSFARISSRPGQSCQSQPDLGLRFPLHLPGSPVRVTPHSTAERRKESFFRTP